MNYKFDPAIFFKRMKPLGCKFLKIKKNIIDIIYFIVPANICASSRGKTEGASVILKNFGVKRM